MSDRATLAQAYREVRGEVPVPVVWIALESDFTLDTQGRAKGWRFSGYSGRLGCSVEGSWQAGACEVLRVPFSRRWRDWWQCWRRPRLASELPDSPGWIARSGLTWETASRAQLRCFGERGKLRWSLQIGRDVYFLSLE